MRDIKFRAWHKKVLVMSVYSEDEIGEESFQFTDDEGVRLASDHSLDEALRNRDIELMQYTGLKDKNGVEIYYEADIVYDELLRRSKTVTELTVAHWLIDIDKINNPMSRVEVIGNIYENPDLV